MKHFIFLLKKTAVFIGLLVVLYCIWLPIAPYYLWLRLKLAYLLLNLCSYFPAWEGIKSEKIAGEMFSFLPFLALYLTTLPSWKKINYLFLLWVFLSLFSVEVLGRFFEKYAFYKPGQTGYLYFTILMLGTLRVALPFIIWIGYMIKSKQSLLS
ncbi:hypothetical protein LLG10_03050 [bacterium]|nr:hypothetical protein [bacterium]